MKSRQGHRWFGPGFGLTTALVDQATKWIAIQLWSTPWGPFHASFNSCLAFYLSADATVLAPIAVVSGVLLVDAVRLIRAGHLSQLALWAIGAGFLSNLVDRLVREGVVDWLDIAYPVVEILDLGRHTYVVTNVADVAIFIGLAGYVRAAWHRVGEDQLAAA